MRSKLLFALVILILPAISQATPTPPPKFTGPPETFVGLLSGDKVLLTVSLADGKILAGTMDNVVKTVQRTCDDDALTHCTDPAPHEIHRKIEIELVR